jgi:pimeloyl-ACP methyl ester carboxylesterase
MEIQRNGSKLFYEKAGTGRKNMLLFHGFGQNHTVFKSLTDALSRDYTCYSFDLFFHGQSTWAKGETPIQKDEWREIMLQFLAKENISRFTILGFSIGARFALSAFESLPEQVEAIVLVAPDGIVASPWYSIATSTSPGRMFFRTVMRNPQIFPLLSLFVQKSNIADPKVLRFAELQMKSQENRNRIYSSWIAFRTLKPNIGTLVGKLNALKIPVLVYVGQSDKIIESKKLRSLLDPVRSARIHLIDRSHHALLSQLPGRLLTDLQREVITDT